MIPEKLSLICDKCLRVNRDSRYSSVAALLDDLADWQRTAGGGIGEGLSQLSHNGSWADNSASQSGTTTGKVGLPSGSECLQEIRIRPRGLSSYDEADRHFFIRLLPGDLEPNGIPESLDYWLKRLQVINSTSDSDGFSVGVIPVQLAVFAQMYRDLEWTPDELARQGGATGAGVRFLEQQFSSADTPERQRRHFDAVCRILEELLPPTGSQIRGRMQSRQRLMVVSGYAQRPAKFEELMQILEQELRILTRTDAAEQSAAGRDDHGPRAYFVDELSRWKVPVQDLLEVARKTESPPLHSAICLGIGSRSRQILAPEDMSLAKILADSLLDSPDAACHTATAGNGNV
jgi:hypothetical protein